MCVVFVCRGASKTGKHCAIKSGKLLSDVRMALEQGWMVEKVAALRRRIGLCGDAT
jgi:hypothetical protein